MRIFGIAFMAALIATLIRLIFATTNAIINGPVMVTAIESAVTALITLGLTFFGTVAVLVLIDLWEDI